MKNKSLLKSAAIVMMCTVLSKIMGLTRDIIIASEFGAGFELDAFFAASNIPSILFITIGVAITTTLIPLYSEKLREGREVAFEFINNILNCFIVFTSIISIICMIFNGRIVSLLNPGFYGKELMLTRTLTLILIPTLIINAVIFIFNGVLQSENNFIIPALIAIPFNILIICYLFIFKNRNNIFELTIVIIIATIIQIIPQLISVYKYGFRYKFKINLKDPTLKRMIYMLIPVILGTGVQQINGFIERGVATKFSTGSLSSLSYAYKIFSLIVDVFVVTLSTVIYPKMAREIASNKIEAMKCTLNKSMKILIEVTLPLSVIVMIQCKPIVYILFERGQFTSQNTIITSEVLFMYSIGIVSFGLRDFVCKAYYTLKDTRTPMINSAIAMIINIVLIAIFIRFFGLKGIPLASAVSMYIACMLLIINIRKKIGPIGCKGIMIVCIKTTICSVLMLLSIVFLNRLLDIRYVSTINVLIKIMISTGTGLAVYIISAFLIGLDDIIILKKYFKIYKI